MMPEHTRLGWRLMNGSGSFQRIVNRLTRHLELSCNLSLFVPKRQQNFDLSYVLVCELWLTRIFTLRFSNSDPFSLPFADLGPLKIGNCSQKSQHKLLRWVCFVFGHRETLRQ